MRRSWLAGEEMGQRFAGLTVVMLFPRHAGFQPGFSSGAAGADGEGDERALSERSAADKPLPALLCDLAVPLHCLHTLSQDRFAGFCQRRLSNQANQNRPALTLAILMHRRDRASLAMRRSDYGRRVSSLPIYGRSASGIGRCRRRSGSFPAPPPGCGPRPGQSRSACAPACFCPVRS